MVILYSQASESLANAGPTLGIKTSYEVTPVSVTHNETECHADSHSMSVVDTTSSPKSKLVHLFDGELLSLTGTL
jgi:hypothetical protein